MKLVYNVKEREISMNSFILINKALQKRQEYLATFSSKNTISAFDQTIIAEEGSIGIDIVRKMQQTLLLKPYKGKYKSIILENAQNLTLEAQNAMLKLLEEPPSYVYIFLSATTMQNFLPTILSRCQVIQLSEEDKKSLTSEEIQQLSQQIDIMLSGTTSEKLSLAEALSSEKDALPLWLEHVLQIVRVAMLEKEEKVQNAKFLLTLQETYKLLTTTNVNPRTLLEHCFLNI